MFLDTIINYLFVPHCPACDERMPTPAPLCDRCAESLYPLGPACPRCAEPIEGPVALTCARCKRRPLPLAAAHAPYRFGGELGVALRRLKRDHRPDIARSLAPLLAPALAHIAPGVDLAVPVPLHWRRMSQRGFNQAHALLRYAARGLALPIDAASLRRVRATAPQRGLDARRRAENLAGAFALSPRRRPRVAGRTVLVVDDVMTTGATLASAARALRAAGAARVVGLTLARAAA